MHSILQKDVFRCFKGHYLKGIVSGQAPVFKYGTFRKKKKYILIYCHKHFTCKSIQLLAGFVHLCLISAAAYIIFVWYLLIRVRENMVFLHPESGKKASVFTQKVTESQGVFFLETRMNPACVVWQVAWFSNIRSKI